LVTRSPTKQTQEPDKPRVQLHIDSEEVSTRATADQSSDLICTQRRPGTYQGLPGAPQPALLQRYGAPQPWDVESQAWQGGVIFAVGPADVVIDFEGVPTVTEPKAKVLLSRIPWVTLQPLLSGIRSWIRGYPVKAARVFAFSDPEVEDWEEVVVELLVDADTPTALRLWDELAGAVDHATESLSDDQRRLLNSQVSVSLAWGDEPSNRHI